MPPTDFLKIHLILSSHLRISLLSGVISSVSAPNPTCTPAFPRTCLSLHILLHLILRIIFSEEYRPYSSSLLSTLPCYLVPLKLRYLPEHPILEQPKPVSLPPCTRRRFTPIQNEYQDFSAQFVCSEYRM